MSKDKDGKAEEEPKKKSKKMLIILIAVVLAAGGGGAYFFLGRSGPSAPEPGKVLPLDSITVNLAGGHYLKLKLSLQATTDAGTDLDGSKALDIAVTEFSNRTVASLSGNPERERCKAELKEKVVKAYDEEVMDVYLTEFVMQ